MGKAKAHTAALRAACGGMERVGVSEGVNVFWKDDAAEHVAQLAAPLAALFAVSMWALLCFVSTSGLALYSCMPYPLEVLFSIWSRRSWVGHHALFLSLFSRVGVRGGLCS